MKMNENEIINWRDNPGYHLNITNTHIQKLRQKLCVCKYKDYKIIEERLNHWKSIKETIGNYIKEGNV